MDESRINVWADSLWETALRSRNKELFKRGIINLLNEYAPSLTSQDRLRIGITTRKGSGDKEGDISNAAWLLHVQRRTAEVKMMDDEMRARKLGKSHTAKLAEGEE